MTKLEERKAARDAAWAAYEAAEAAWFAWAAGAAWDDYYEELKKTKEGTSQARPRQHIALT